MSGIEIFQVIFLIAVFAVGVGGFIWAATSKDSKED
jgi:nitrogen fixation-related uncharacterized protein